MTVTILFGGCGKAIPASENVEVVENAEEAFGESNNEPKNETQSERDDEQITQEINTNEITSISIDFDYMRMSGKASNQIALWIEDEVGTIVKTLLVTDFTAARRGYENREDALNHWVDSAKPAYLSDGEIDAISSATPQEGTQHFKWDLTDENGQRVPDGRYYIRLEGTLYWSSNVVYTGMVDLKDAVPGELEITTKRSEPDNTGNETMLQNVRMKAEGITE